MRAQHGLELTRLLTFRAEGLRESNGLHHFTQHLACSLPPIFYISYFLFIFLYIRTITYDSVYSLLKQKI